jgi:alpha/beta superfamily hydrolase
VVWITGGFPVARGGAVVWTRGPDDNEQSASAYREAGFAMMFPTIRGTNDNPGLQETFLGEVDDILAAAKYLRSREFVDPEEIYLGGHSTGAMLALLVAESTDVFKAVFCFGPAAEVGDYGVTPFDTTNPREFYLRSPIHFLDAIGSPTLLIEGETGRSEQLNAMADACLNPEVRFALIPGADHFAPLAAVNRFLAGRIGESVGKEFQVSVEQIVHAFRDHGRSLRAESDRASLLALSERSASLHEPHRVQFSIVAPRREPLEALRQRLEQQGFRWTGIEVQPVHEGHHHHALKVSKILIPQDFEALHQASWTVAETAEGALLEYAGWQARRRASY